MMLIKDGVGKKRGRKGVTIKVERQNSREAIKSLTITKMNTYEVYDLLKDKVIPLFEDKINVSNVLEFTNLLKKKVDKEVEHFIELFEEKIRR